MANNADNKFSPESVCKSLLKRGLISAATGREILRNQRNIRRRLERARAMGETSSHSKGRISNTVTIIDVISSLDLERADDPSKALDEESIYQVLAKEWKIPYKKIDPLHLDLNLVTDTIPRSFAMRHLVLPIAIEDGCMAVATPDPFNVEAMEDISRVCHMKVKPVVSAKTDIVKLMNEFFGFKRSIAAAEDQFAGPSVDLGNLEQYVRLKSADELPSDDQHIVHAVNHLLGYAFDQRASDVHI